MPKDKIDDLMLVFQDLVQTVESTHSELYKLCSKGRVTSGRDFRRKMREIRAKSTAATKLSQNIENNLREVKKEKKNAWV